LNEGNEHARKFLHKDAGEANKGVTYKRIREIVEIVFESESYTSSLERDSSHKEGSGAKSLNDLLASTSCIVFSNCLC
jgi:hypothetical protein